MVAFWDASVSQAELSALRASHFLLLRQKKVSKEKATPGCAVGFADSPALLETPGGWLNSPAAQTTPADCPRRSCVARHLSRGPVNQPCSTFGFHFWPFFPVDRNSLFFCSPVVPHRLSGPHVARRATQALAEKGRGLFEGRSPEFRSPRQWRVAQGTGVAGADPGVAFFLLTFSWRSKKK